MKCYRIERFLKILFGFFFMKWCLAELWPLNNKERFCGFFQKYNDLRLVLGNFLALLIFAVTENTQTSIKSSHITSNLSNQSSIQLLNWLSSDDTCDYWTFLLFASFALNLRICIAWLTFRRILSIMIYSLC